MFYLAKTQKKRGFDMMNIRVHTVCPVLVLQHYYEEDDKVSAMETMRNAFEANSENVTAEGLNL